MLEQASDGCASCGAGGAPGKGAGGLCEACLDTEFPPVAARGSKWSPLALGVLSLFCDPLMIPTVLAIARGFGELRELARREARGIYREEHATVRTGAVWGILIGGARPLAFGIVLLFAAVIDAADSPVPYPVMEVDELSEILDRVGSDDASERDLALTHLDALAPTLSLGETRRVLDAADPDADPPLTLATRSWMVGSAALSPHGLTVEMARFVALYPTLDALGREELLTAMVERGSPDALSELGRLAGADVDPDGPLLPGAALIAYPNHARSFVEPLVRLPADASLRHGVPRLLAGLCRAGLDHGVLAPVRERLIADWNQTRASLPADLAEADPGTARRAELARLELAALRCLDGDDVDALLVEASAHENPLIAVAAVSTLLSREHAVGRSTLQRLAADRFSRVELVAALHARGREREVAAAHRTERAIAESELVRTAYLDGEGSLSVEWVERVEPRSGIGVHVFTATYVDMDGAPATERVAVGPYPASLTRERPTLVWETDALPAGSDNAVLAGVLLDEHDAALDEEAP